MLRSFSLVLILSQATFAQSPTKPPEFEVAEIRVSESVNLEQGRGSMAGGRIDLPNFTLKSIIMMSGRPYLRLLATSS
jgi:hypothetical protein